MVAPVTYLGMRLDGGKDLTQSKGLVRLLHRSQQVMARLLDPV